MTTLTRPVEATIAEPPRPARRRRRMRWLLPTWSWLVIAWLSAPIIVMIVFGFNDTKSKFNIRWQGFTLRWYRELFAISDLTNALQNSVTIAVITTLIATVLGTLLGMFSVAYVAITVRARVVGLDRSLEEAARDLGANAWATFWKVTLPLIAPGVMAGALLAFALSIDDFIITNFNSGNTVTFPLWVWGASRVGVPPQVNVMGTLIFMFGVLLAVVGATANRRKRV